MPLLQPYVRSHKMTYFTIYNNSTNKLHTNILKMVIHTMTSSMADRNIWEVAVYRTIFNILVCIWLVLLSSIISQCMDYGSNRADLLHFWVCGALYKMHSFVKGITLKRKLCQSLRMPQILNSVCSLITSQTPSEYIHKNYDLTRMIFDYQHTK